MMKIGIMQPYFFPYIGYWQLFAAVDKYIFLDDVNYINRGWINRNRILLNGEAHFFNIELSKASQNKLINEIEVINNEKAIDDRLRTISMAYKKAPFFEDGIQLVEESLRSGLTNLSQFNIHTIRLLAAYLGIDTEILVSSEINKDENMKGKDRIIDICRILETDEYWNAIGGKSLYSATDFSEYGIDLFFLRTNEISYKQYSNDFVPGLSIIDIIMFNSKETIRGYLDEFVLERE